MEQKPAPQQAKPKVVQQTNKYQPVLPAQVPKGKVRIKMFKSVGPHMMDTIVDVSPEDAKMLCRDGGKFAKSLADIEALQNAPVEELFSDEMIQAGRKNIVETPKDPAFDAKIAALAEKKDLPIDEKAQAAETENKGE